MRWNENETVSSIYAASTKQLVALGFYGITEHINASNKDIVVPGNTSALGKRIITVYENAVCPSVHF